MQVSDFAGEAPAVLFVDDEPTSRKWFAREFGDEFRVQTAGGADEALSILRERSQEFGVLVTDYRMPQLDGLGLLTEAEKLRPGLPRILVTAYDRDLVGALHGRRERILEKPVDADRLLREVRRAMAMEGSR